MKRSPIRQKESLAPLPIIGFEIGPAGLAIVDTKVFFSLDRKGREPMIVRTFAERAPNSPISPARAAAAAREQTPAAGVDADQLGHRGQGSARRAITAKPSLFVSPTVEGVHHGAEEPRRRRPRQITQQPGEQRSERLVAQQKVRGCAARPGAHAAVLCREREFSPQSFPRTFPRPVFPEALPP